MERITTTGLVSFAQNQSILGLERHPKVQAAWRMAARSIPSTEQIQFAEGSFAAWLGSEDAIIVPKPFPAHRLAITALMDGESALIYDERAPSRFISASKSLVERGALQYTFAHHEPEALANVFKLVPPTRQPFVMMRSVSTNTGRKAPLATCYSICNAYGGILIIEDTITLGLRGSEGRSIYADVPYASEGSICVADLEPTFGWPGTLISGPRRPLLMIRERLLITSQYRWQPLDPLMIALRIIDSQSGEHLRLHLSKLGQHLVHGARRMGLAMFGTGPLVALSCLDKSTAELALRTLNHWGCTANLTKTPTGICSLTFAITTQHTEDQVERLLRGLAKLRSRLISTSATLADQVSQSAA